MRIVLWVGLGSAVGGMLRFGLGVIWHGQFDTFFPWETLIVNVVGSFAIGLLASQAGPQRRIDLHPEIRIGLVSGFSGGFTTFSFLSWQSLRLFMAGWTAVAVGYALMSVALSIGAVWLGWRWGSSAEGTS
jgi:fluoride exporter